MTLQKSRAFCLIFKIVSSVSKTSLI